MQELYKYEDKVNLIKELNELKGYQGYIQFSDKKIRACDIFQAYQDIKLTPTDGFIYEAHFSNDIKSISIKQINDTWLVSTTHFSEIDNKEKDIQTYQSIAGDIKMAQIWEAKADGLCADMKVKKLQKVVFVGFEKGESK